jgi:hypothetical protein
MSANGGCSRSPKVAVATADHAIANGVAVGLPSLTTVTGDSTLNPAWLDLPFADLDAAAVAQVSKAISAAIILETLIERILGLALENSGAGRGVLRQ